MTRHGKLREYRCTPQQQKIRHIRHRYGLEPEEYEALFAKQNNRCAICNKEGGDTKGTRLYVDHNHETGKVRGLLCAGCNTAVGFLEKRADDLHKYFSYMETRNE